MGVIHGFLKELLESSIGSRVCKAELWSVDQIGGWQVRYGQLAQMQPMDTGQLRSDALQRFTSLAMNVDREIVNSVKACAAGMPRRGGTSSRSSGR